MANKTVSQRLADFVLSINYSQLPSEVIDKTKTLLIDSLGVTVGGASTPQARLITEILADSGCPEATVFGSWQKCSALQVAFINAFLAHCLELDDWHRQGFVHAGSVIIPTALAMSESEKASGRSLLEAVVAGYEVAIRVGMAAGRSHYALWHSTGTCGAFGAATAAAKLLNLDAQSIATALGHAGTLTSGLWEFITLGSIAKPLIPAHAAWLGILSAFLARANLPSPLTIFEGERGFFKAMAPASRASNILSKLGTGYQITSVSIKFYPCCRYIHSAIDAAINLSHEVNSATVIKIKISTFNEAIRVAGLRVPTTLEEARFSLTYCFAAALKYGKLGNEELKAGLQAEDLRRLENLTEIEVSPEFDSLFPQSQSCLVEIVTKDNTKKQRVDHPRGDPENPLSPTELRQRFLNLVSPSLGKEKAQNLLHSLYQIETLSHLDILDLISPRQTEPPTSAL